MITVFTAITKTKDELREDFPETDDKYIAFLDKETKEEELVSNLWEIRPACNIFKESRRNAKIHKVMPHLYLETDYSIWIDGNISINITPQEIVDKWLGDKDIATWKHFARDCWYEEARCLEGPGWDKDGLVKEQIDRYEKIGVPKKTGLSECNVIVRRHTDEIARLNEKWWAEICRGSSRDQISFGYVFEDKVNRIEGNPRMHEDFNYKPHNFVEVDYAKENNI